MSLIAALLAAATVLLLPAQTVFTGELTGSVTDPSGTAIAAAKVDLTSDSTGQTSSIATTSTGRFRFPLLRPGAYTLTVSARGFETKSQRATVELGQSSNVGVQLGIQPQKQEVFVTERAPLLQSNNANLVTTFNERELQNLPDPGNDLTVFAFTTPGVTMSTGGGYGNFSVFGLPAISNLFTMNGTDITDPYVNLNASGATNLTLGANEIQEAAVVVNGYTGQYGRQAGANVNYLTKSGTNAFHSNASWYYNGRVFNANDWFNNAFGIPRPFSISNSWADSLGGPIVKNRLFFFINNEGMRYVLPGGGQVYIPTPDFSRFVLTRLAAENPAAVPLYTTVMNLYAGSSGAARATPVTAAWDSQLGCGDLADAVYGISKPCAETFRSTVNSVSTEWLLAAKVDYNLTANDRMYLRLNTDHGLRAPGTDPINPVFTAISSQPSYGGQFGYTKVIGSNSVNALLLSAEYGSGLVGPRNLQAALRAFPTSFLFNDGLLTNLGGDDYAYPNGRRGRQWQLVDDYSFVSGRHTLKAGANVRRSFTSTYFYGAGTSGRLIFNSMTDFVNGSLMNGSTYAQAFSTVGAEDLTAYSAGFYGQDEWRVRPDLTVTLALRLDRNSNIDCAGACFTELAGQGSFDQMEHSATIPYNQAIRTGLRNVFHGIDPIIPEPRLGVAYNLTRSTVLRGGVGLFADSNPGLIADRFITNAPTESLFTATSGLVATGVPNGVFAMLAKSATALQQGFANGATLAQLLAHVPLFKRPNFFTISQDVHTPRYYEWNFELQHGFGEKYLLSANYVGNHGFDELIQQVFGNGYSRAGLAGLPTAAPDPRFGQIIALNNQGWSNYDGLVTSFKWRPNAQFSGQFSYTWSHSLDTCSNDCVPEAFDATGLRFQLNPAGLRNGNYSNSDYDVRHSLNATYVYMLPALRFNPIVKAVFGGWTAAGSLFYHSGYPFSIVDTAVLSQFGNLSGKVAQAVLADFLGSTSYPSCTAPNVTCYSKSQFATKTAQHDFGNIPRNSFRGPGYFDTDLNLNKTFTFAEKCKLVIGSSFFNVLNHPNFGLPDNNVASGSFGRIGSTVSAPTGAYGVVPGSTASGRVIQTVVKFSF